ncbi:cyclin G-associated kinase [Vigna unguiculata]|uniref:Cyclin G-associated kinase n=1 Tax=Vigna unguiculata TaxID=3917 RepID=A0A4D6KYR6_VIGUN|nr:cyclin G-associated kinase [Vigna unguiculata]
MESLAHSRQPNKFPVTVSKKITGAAGGAGFPAETLYDHVYGGATRFAGGHSLSPRFEDYGEIFSSFHAPRASAIPVLDLPSLDDGEVFFDFRNVACDYSEIFRGFDGLDFRLSYEDLFHDSVSEEDDGDDAEEEEAWTPVETDSFSGDLDHFGFHEGMPNDDHFRSSDGITEFNVLYHKVNGTGNEDMSKGKSTISQLRAAPEFGQIFDETTHFHRTDPSLQVVDDVDLDMEFNASQARRNHREMVSLPVNFTSGEQVFGSDLDLRSGCCKNDSHSSETFITVSHISLRTLPSQVPPPSRPPPVLDAKQEYTGGFLSKKEGIDIEETLGDTSPPFLDVEVDTNSSAASIKEVMHRSEAKHRSAKELKERKKRLSESNADSRYDVKVNEAKTSVNITKFDSLNDKGVQRIGKKKISFTDERQKTGKAAPETLELLEGERLLNVFDETHIKESRSSQESDRSTGIGMWKEATEFFELVGTEEPGKVITPTKHSHTKKLVQDIRAHECGKEEREAFNVKAEYKKVGEVEGPQQEECKEKYKVGNGAHEQRKTIKKSKLSDEEFRQREHVKNEEMAEIFGLEKSEKARVVNLHGKTDQKVPKTDQPGCLKDMFETQRKEHKQVEIEKSEEVDRERLSEVQCRMKHMESEKKQKEDEQLLLSMKRHKQSQRMKENGKIQREASALGGVESEQRVKDSVKLEKFERSNEACTLDSHKENMTYKIEDEIILEATQIHKKKQLKETCQNEVGKSRKGSCTMEENHECLKDALEQVKNEKGLKRDFELEMNEKRSGVTFELGENEPCEKDQGKEKLNEICDGYRKGDRLKDMGEGIWLQNVLKQAPELQMNIGNETQRKKEIDCPSDLACDSEGTVDKSREYSVDKALEQTEGDGKGIHLNFAKETSEERNTESDDNLVSAHSSSIHEENICIKELCQDPIADQEIGKSVTACKIDEKKLEEVCSENLKDTGKKGAFEMSQGELEHSGKMTCTSTNVNVNEHSFNSEQACTKETKPAPQMEFDARNGVRTIDGWESRDRMSLSHANVCVDYGRNTVADEPATVQEAVNIKKSSERGHASNSTKSKDKSLDETSASIEKDAERIRRERELEEDRLRKIEEEMERERERQKDRMAVDRAVLEAERERERGKDRMAVDKATLEARDRTYTEARERAERAAFERATAEARQRVLAEARERLEKACAEARDKTYADKVAAEARLKAQRTAVERATVEARERAMEKVKVERAAFESRERLGRSVSDKFSVPSRNSGRQGSSSSDMLDPFCQNSSSSTHSRYPYSSVYGASSFTERSEREGESAQRCRARLERYRRTAERAAKALEEKNMRDLVAQKEQAERNRLAETLDIEVRRWSSGKEGNLRALLSTLQYILGPDSGWQPIPLTDVITSAAVKKAYRKATLCVHPDKLQQRGASIQHKYICEKVFDLLKEAWNKFNSEER